ncbi:transposase [Fervidibacillus albus]|uniref:transposase n=1 Tax=Fervidibacillus albus TaxID=2980026 RepID=UPI0030841763
MVTRLPERKCRTTFVDSNCRWRRESSYDYNELFYLTAKDIADLYRYRWKIEIFFKWMKQHLKIKTFYGHSENAVYNQIWIALITYLLQVLIQLKYHHKRKSSRSPKVCN